MPVISFASSKGGVGKTTTSLLLAMTFVDRALNVALLDCDPNQPLTKWADTAHRRPVPTVIGNIKTDTLITTIDTEAARRDLVLIDLEGSASRIAGYAIARSDLVIVPMGPSCLDAHEAARAIDLVRQEEQLLRRSIAARVLLTQTKAIATKSEKALKRELTAAGVGFFKQQVTSRVSYEWIFAERSTLRDLDQTKIAGIPQAIANIEALADEVLSVLTMGQGKEAA